MKQQLLHKASILVSLVILFGCAGAKITEEKPLTEKLGQFKHVAITASATDKKAEQLVGDLESSLFKRIQKAKLFPTATFGNSVDKSADLIIKADIYNSKIADTSAFKISWGAPEPAVQLNIRYTIMSKKDNKVLGSFVSASDSSGQTTIGGISTNTDKGHALGKSNDQLVKYVKDHL